jgi:hypothetical protein
LRTFLRPQENHGNVVKVAALSARRPSRGVIGYAAASRTMRGDAQQGLCGSARFAAARSPILQGAHRYAQQVQKRGQSRLSDKSAL